MMGSRRYMRDRGGRFKSPTLADINMAVCPECGRIVPIKWVYTKDGFIDPRASRQIDCDHTNKSGTLVVKREASND